VSLADAVASLHDGDKRPPARQVAVTIDDGYRDFYLYAYPILSAYRIPATVFLVTDFIDRKGWLWWDAMVYALGHTKQSVAEVPLASGEVLRLTLDSMEQRAAAAIALAEGLKTVSNSGRLQVLAEIPRQLKVSVPDEPTERYAPLTWEEVRLTAAHGIEFGAHTKTHPILSRVSDEEELRNEIEGSKIRIEEELGRDVIQFCYPNGQPGDFLPETVETIRKSGFRIAVTTCSGLNFRGADPLQLCRIGVLPNCSQWVYSEQVDALWRLVRL
jgi:peptidoglycan/xylan/chitin deacetylase (PgdA/CDA1 family)